MDNSTDPRESAQVAAANNPYSSPESPDDLIAFRQVTRSDETLNPWFSIWTRPRATIRQIIETDPERMVIPLAALAGVGQTLSNASDRSLGDQLPVVGILVLVFTFGPIGGVIGLYVMAAIVHGTGRWLGGVANRVEVRAAIAWGSVPGIWASLLWIPMIALVGSEMFTSESPRLEGSTGLLGVFIAFGVVQFVVGIWQLVVYLKCVGEVQEFSAWRALGAMLLAGLVFAGAIMGIVIIAVAVMAAAGAM